MVNGVPLDERSYVSEDSPIELPPNAKECRSRQFTEVVVPPGQIFVMGDHRLVSQDARCQGPVPIDNVIGRAFMIVWPSQRWATLPVPRTFADLPQPDAAPARPVPVDPDPVGGVVLILPVTAALRRSRAFGATAPYRAT